MIDTLFVTVQLYMHVCLYETLVHSQMILNGKKICIFYVFCDLQKKDSSLLKTSCRVICDKYPSMNYPIEVTMISLMDEPLCKAIFCNLTNDFRVLDICFLCVLSSKSSIFPMINRQLFSLCLLPLSP
jgi:hypothetical protein